MMKGSKYFTGLLLMCLATVAMSQEVLTGLSFNEAVSREAARIAGQEKLSGVKQENTAALTLPFFDDFSTANIFPDKSKWKDRAVYVNQSFAYFPTNIGAATFDALDSTGKIYANADWVPFEADKLTSNAIRLDSVFDPVVRALSPADSLYLSFFYQPQGYGRKPEEWDTLILEFSYLGDTAFAYYDTVLVPFNEILPSPLDTIHPGDTIWVPKDYGCDTNLYRISFLTYGWEDWIWLPCDSVMLPTTEWDKVWQVDGQSLNDFLQENERYFVQVMVPVLDPKYFTASFHFRFRNYASIANDIIPSFRSNDDQWNVDYVYLNYNRERSDTTYRVLTFSQRAPSFLKDYQVIPYKQYLADPFNSVRDEFPMYIVNLDKPEETHDASYLYTVDQVNGNFRYWYDGGVCNLLPFYPGNTFQDTLSCREQAMPPVNSLFSLDYDLDTTSYIIRHYISDSSTIDIIVDSVIYRQGFYNYYAYDDGSPEAGYGIENAGAMMAYRFTMTVPDTLFGVQMYFNRTENHANELPFDLMVWRDNNGKPGEVVYVMENQEVKWADKGLYRFYPYLFEEPLVMTGTFYVGWLQYENGSLNVGFDANNDHANNIMYYAEDEWYISNRSGSLLIRPMIGSDLILGREEPEDKTGLEVLALYPNPARDYFELDVAALADSPSASLEIYSIYGQLVLQQNVSRKRVDVSRLSRGMYVVRLKSKNKMYAAKLLINR
ncbi:MAG: T9SS type A sorting domain-containing protein [Bacteroidales bacterium]|nr:T9SS type A sorting domain-containing protein [Bacteroidales bacterium]MCF6341295.1 T9SS type A sorting domain-containing protein [Bacteroidales bacterium]